jgi:hypothetical protein
MLHVTISCINHRIDEEIISEIARDDRPLCLIVEKKVEYQTGAAKINPARDMCKGSNFEQAVLTS